MFDKLIWIAAVVVFVGFGGLCIRELWRSALMPDREDITDIYPNEELRVWTVDGYREYKIDKNGEIVCIRQVLF